MMILNKFKNVAIKIKDNITSLVQHDYNFNIQ